MDLREVIRAALQELIVPELDQIKKDQTEAKVQMAAIHKRLDDVHIHLVDQSRRIDAVREELGRRIDQTNERIDETNDRIDAVREELGRRIDQTNERIDETNDRIDAVREELGRRMDENTARADAINQRLDRFLGEMVRRHEHVQLVERVAVLEHDLRELKKKVA